MTSKEAINQLLYYATLDDSGFEPHMKEYADIIKKDLEVLKILRKLFKKDLYIYQREEIDNNFEFTGKQIYCIAKIFNGDDLTFNNQQDILKLKEWIEDDC